MTRLTLNHAVFFLGATTLVACAGDGADTPMRIIGNVAPEANCSVNADSTLFRDDGVIEASSFYGYVFTPTVINDLVLLEGELTAPKTIYVEGARVEIDFFDTATFPSGTFNADLLRFRVPTSGSIAPGGGISAFSFEIVPAELLAGIGAVLGPTVNGEAPPRTTLDVRVQMVGTRSGEPVESNIFRYPIQVCNGCLANDLGPCAALPDGFTASGGGVCNAVQDGVIDCCDNFSVCPAVAPSGT